MAKDSYLPLCSSCSKLDVASLARPPVPCRKPLPCNGAVGERNVIVFEGPPPEHKPFGSLDEIRNRRGACGLCSLVAESLDQEPSDAAGTCRLIERAEVCLFELPDGVRSHDPAVTHFHYTRPNILFDPSNLNDFLGPVLPWQAKDVERKRAHNVLKFQLKVVPEGHSTTQSREQDIIDGVGGRQVTDQFNVNLLRKWLRLCETCHGPQCKHPLRLPTTQETGPALLIDVTDSCIVETPAGCRYVALSYVWGTAPVFRHLKENSERIRKPGSLKEIRLPASIRDSMLLVQQMGERFLWVDSICIIQDDFKTQQSQIMRMGSIYSKAVFTIVVAFGNGANSGLPGVSPGVRKQTQKNLRIGDKELLTVIDNDGVNEGVGDSIWATRAWTFQERLLSKRVLVFTETQAYWNCRSAVFSEEFAAEEIRNPFYRHLSIGQSYLHRDIPDQEVAPGEFCLLYEGLLTAYRQRRLTYQSDILNAFAGISEILSMRQNDTYTWGISQAYFSYALLWHFTGYHKRHDEKVPVMTLKSREPEHLPVPSWSWAAWSGEKRLPWLGMGWSNPRAPNGIEITAVINFDIVNTDGKLVKIEDRLPSTHGSTESQSMLSQWRHPDGITSSCAMDRTNDPKATATSWSTRRLHGCCDMALGIGQIHFWTSVAKLRVVRKELEEPQAPICDAYSVEDDSSLYEDMLSTNLMIGSTSHIPGERLESRSKLMECKPTQYSSGVDLIWLDFVVVAKREACSSKYPSLMLLAVEWKEGIAYRLGLALMPEPVWIKKKNREWRHVVLG
ncbi:heterokaryon incompatibility protein-domain-containing protein [Phyllosticta citriasiana]|uniref:heterokaryon incompatibility protein-domain-containing protein n=1 Tax=Phyllosticta citriasiana TaxID=595635 RepID=UPI0030FDE2F9